MFGFIKKIFGAKPAEPVAPYKVEAPVATTPVAEKATEAAVKSVAKPATVKLRQPGTPKKQGAPKKQGGNKPKAPRKPKAPKQPK